MGNPETDTASRGVIDVTKQDVDEDLSLNNNNKDESFQFQFFDEKTCEFMTPPPSNAKRGVKFPPSSATGLVNVDWQTGVSPIAPTQDGNGEEEDHLLPMNDDSSPSTSRGKMYIHRYNFHSNSMPCTYHFNGPSEESPAVTITRSFGEKKKEALSPTVHPALRDLSKDSVNTSLSQIDETQDRFSPDLSLGALKEDEESKEGTANNNKDASIEKSNHANDTEDAKEINSILSINDTSKHDASPSIEETEIPQDQTGSPAPLQTLTPRAKQLQLDFTSARKLIDESSNQFIERLRSAAHRRKLAMAKSRDSLAAKEREQQQHAMEESKKRAELAAKAAAEAAEEAKRVLEEKIEAKRKQKVAEEEAMFKARPLPSTNGVKGMGGLAGVPKVETKPTTTPFSPLLGNRRKSKNKIKALEPPKTLHKPKAMGPKAVLAPSTKTKTNAKSSNTDNGGTTFKARPLPKSNGVAGNGGQLGIPKVSKRPVTVPFSPLLGNRRKSIPSTDSSSMPKPFGSNGKSRSAGNVLEGQQDSARQSLLSDCTNLNQSSSASKYSFISAGKSPLVGLNFLATTPSSVHARYSTGEEENITPKNVTSTAYIPHSTIRAQKRAAYDAVREEREEERHEQEKLKLEAQIREMHRHLRTLRHDLEF
jgi:hypothetical protein